MDTETKLANAYKIYMMKHPSSNSFPTLKELDKEHLLDNVDLDENDEGIEELYSSSTNFIWNEDGISED